MFWEVIFELLRARIPRKSLSSHTQNPTPPKPILVGSEFTPCLGLREFRGLGFKVEG